MGLPQIDGPEVSSARTFFWKLPSEAAPVRVIVGNLAHSRSILCLRPHPVRWMNIEAFRRTLSEDTAPDVSPELRALWQDAQGDWHEAHRTVQSQSGRSAAWVHAYLHRKEGGHSNAAYWYRRASEPVCNTSLDEEWSTITSALLSGDG